MKRSTFDDGEEPPQKTYDDWKDRDVKNFKIELQNSDGELIRTWKDARKIAVTRFGRVLRDITDEAESESLGFAVFLVPKVRQ